MGEALLKTELEEAYEVGFARAIHVIFDHISKNKIHELNHYIDNYFETQGGANGQKRKIIPEDMPRLNAILINSKITKGQNYRRKLKCS